MSTVLALVAIILGFISGIADEDIIFPAMTWFVLAIALNLLALPGLGVFTTRKVE